MSQRSRTDLCGGCRATGIPTATFFDTVPFPSPLWAESRSTLSRAIENILQPEPEPEL